MDSDDRIHEKLVEETVKEAEKNQADIVIFDYIGEEMDGQLSDRFTFDFPGKKSYKCSRTKESYNEFLFCGK